MLSSSVTTTEASARQECLDSLDEFISKCQENITAMLDTLGWTPEHFVQPRTLTTCPYNSDHKMPKSSLETHKAVCNLVTQGCSKEDAMKILEDTSYYYAKASCVYNVKLDIETLNSVLWNHHVQNHSVFYGYKKMAQTPEEEQSMMSREDRLGLAEYIIKRAKEANRLKELGQDELLVSENLADLIKKDNEERKLDPVEEMAALRDYRRRRQTYRAKNVHITKKSHTEIMREVINNQIEMYSQSLKTDEVLEEDQDRNVNETRDKDRETSRDRYSERSQHSQTKHRDSRHGSDIRHINRESRDRSSEVSTTYRNRRHSRSRSRSVCRSSSRHREKTRSRSHSRSVERSDKKSKKSKHKKHKHKHRHRTVERDNKVEDNKQLPETVETDISDGDDTKPGNSNTQGT